MSHAVESMMYAGQVPWHGLGFSVPNNVGWDEAIRIAGLDWTVSLHKLYAKNPAWREGMPRDARAIEAPDSRMVLRDSDARPLGTVGTKYEPMQNRDAFATFGTFFGDAAVLNTAGSLHGGRVVWGLAEAPKPFTIAGRDEHRAYLLVTNSHDGSGSLRVYPTTVRVVCANTLAMSRSNQAEGIAIRHVGDPTARLKEQSTVLARAFGLIEAQRVDLEALVETPVTTSDARDILAKLFNPDSAQGRNATDRVLYLASNGAGNAAFAGTAYGLFQGLTDYVDHAAQPSSKGDARFASVLLGSGARKKADGLRVIFQATGTDRPSDHMKVAA